MTLIFRICLLAAASLLVAGCGPSPQQVQQESNIKALTIAYGRFFQTNRGQPPANEAELRGFIDKMTPEELALIGAKDPASIWKSSRDGEPYVVLYGPATGPEGPSGPVVVYESKGVGGKRFVGTTLGNVEEVTEDRFRELVPAANPTP